MGIEPISTCTDSDLYWHGRFDGIHHFFSDDGFDLFQFIYVGVKDQLIMHLQGHFAFEALLFKFFVYAYHGYLDHIRCRSLHRGIDSISLREAAHREIF